MADCTGVRRPTITLIIVQPFTGALLDIHFINHNSILTLVDNELFPMWSVADVSDVSNGC